MVSVKGKCLPHNLPTHHICADLPQSYSTLMTLIIMPVCSFALIWFVLLQKSTPPEDTGLKIPDCSFSKLHCPVCQSQICNQVSRDTVDGQLVSVGPLIRSKLETHVHEQTWATPFLSVTVRDRKSLSLFLHLFHTHTQTQQCFPLNWVSRWGSVEQWSYSVE